MNIIRLMAACALCACATVPSAALAAYSLSPYQNFPTGSWADAVAVGDINGDGLDDIALTTTYYFDAVNDYKVFVYFQQPGGTLAAPLKFSYGVNSNSTGLAIADLDHDGRKDIVVGTGAGITILRWNPLNRKVPMQIRSYPTEADGAAPDVVVVDVNRDGAPDVVGVSGFDGLMIYFGDGHGAISRKLALPASATGGGDLESGDFNGDGYDDVVAMANHNFYPAYVFYNDGTDHMSLPFEVDANPGMNQNSGVLGAGDFNGDGREDLVAMRDETSLSVFLQDGSGGLLPPNTLPSTREPSAMVGADLDLDGLADLVLLNSGGSLSTYMQGSQGLGAETVVWGAGGTWFNSQGLAIGDVNGDDCPDVVTANYSFGLVINAGNGCNAVADVASNLGMTSSVVAVRLDNFGAASAAAPEAIIDLALLNGSLSIGALPAGCAVKSSTAASAKLLCTGTALASGSSRTLLLPIAIAGGDTRNALTATALVSTTTMELHLSNNMARGVLRGFSLAAAQPHSLR